MRRGALVVWVLFIISIPPERGDADERRGGLADPGHPQGHQHTDPQGEDPDGGALHAGGARQDAALRDSGGRCLRGGRQAGEKQQLHRPIAAATLRPGRHPLSQCQLRLIRNGEGGRGAAVARTREAAGRIELTASSSGAQ